MISFRYHLITIVAVFLALALGVVMGTTVIDQGLVTRLERQTADANTAASRARDQRDELEGQVRRERALAEAAVAAQIRNRLLGQDVAIFTDDGTDGPMVQRATRAIEAAGGEVVAVVSTTPRLALDTEADQRELAAVLDMPETARADELQAAVSRALGDRLASGPRPADDVLYGLLEAGFVAGDAGPGLRATDQGTIPGLGGPGQGLLVISGGGPQPPVDPDAVLRPLAAAAIARGGAVVAAEPARTPTPFVVPLRREAEEAFASVDDLDETPGTFSLVVGLEDLLATGRGEAYGFKDGAEALHPPIGP